MPACRGAGGRRFPCIQQRRATEKSAGDLSRCTRSGAASILSTMVKARVQAARRRTAATQLEYMNAAMAKARYELMEDGRFFATIPKFDGLWVAGRTKDEAAKELYDALEG